MRCAPRRQGPAGPPAARLRVAALRGAGAAPRCRRRSGVAAVANFPDGALDTGRALARHASDPRRRRRRSRPGPALARARRGRCGRRGGAGRGGARGLRRQDAQAHHRIRRTAVARTDPPGLPDRARRRRRLPQDQHRQDPHRRDTRCRPRDARNHRRPRAAGSHSASRPRAACARWPMRRSTSRWCARLLGEAALTPQRLRFGASGLLADIEAVLLRQRGAGQAICAAGTIDAAAGRGHPRQARSRRALAGADRGLRARPGRRQLERGPGRRAGDGDRAQRHGHCRMRGPDPRHDALGRSAAVARRAGPRARQAFHRRRGRQGEPDAGADRRGLRRRGADDLGPRPGPHRRHARQARIAARLQHRAVARNAARRAARCRLRHRRRRPHARARRQAALRDPRCDGHGRIGAADHCQHPFQEAGGRTAGAGARREGRQRRVHAAPGRCPCAGGQPGRRGGRRRPAAAGADHRHEPGAGPQRRQRARGAGSDRLPDGRRARAAAARSDAGARGPAAAPGWPGRRPGSRPGARAARALDSGAAAERFARMVSGLGGPATSGRPRASCRSRRVQCDLPAPHDGVLAATDVRAIGLAIVALGGGRRRAEDRIDPARRARAGTAAGQQRPQGPAAGARACGQPGRCRSGDRGAARGPARRTEPAGVGVSRRPR